MRYTNAQHVSMAIFDDQIRAFRDWMKARGQREKPLIVSEYGVIYPFGEFDQATVQDFMIKTFDYFLNTKDCTLGYAADECRLVQRWAWYSFNDDGNLSTFNPYANLFSPQTFQITSTGMRFRDYVTHASRRGWTVTADCPRAGNSHPLGQTTGGICRADIRGRCLRLLRTRTVFAGFRSLLDNSDHAIMPLLTSHPLA